VEREIYSAVAEKLQVHQKSETGEEEQGRLFCFFVLLSFGVFLPFSISPV
jgi:hypothetical protein